LAQARPTPRDGAASLPIEDAQAAKRLQLTRLAREGSPPRLGAGWSGAEPHGSQLTWRRRVCRPDWGQVPSNCVLFPQMGLYC